MNCVTACACPSRDGRRCVEIRYGRRFEADSEDPCDCLCHDIAADDSLDEDISEGAPLGRGRRSSTLGRGGSRAELLAWNKGRRAK